MFSSSSFSFMFHIWVCDTVWVNFCISMSYILRFCFCIWMLNCSNAISCTDYPSSIEMPSSLCQKPSWMYLCRSIAWALRFAHWSLCPSFCQPRAFSITVPLQRVLKPGSVSLPVLFFFKIPLIIVAPLPFNIYFRIGLLISTKKACCDFHWD